MVALVIPVSSDSASQEINARFYGKGIDHLQRQTLSYRKITWANQSSDNVTFHMGKTAQFIGDFNVVADDLYPRIGQAFRQFEAG